MHKRGIKMQTQLFLYFFIVLIALTLILSLFFYDYIADLLIEREITHFRNTSEQYEKTIEDNIRQMDRVSVNMAYSNKIKDSVFKYFSGSINGDDDSIDALATLFAAVNGSDYEVHVINLYDTAGRVVGLGVNAYNDSVDLSALNWTEPARSLKGLKLISLPYQTNKYSLALSSRLWYLSLYRVFYDRTGNVAGYIETIQQCKTIFLEANRDVRASSGDLGIYVFNSGGNMIFPYSDISQEQAGQASAYFTEAGSALDPYERISPITGSPEMVVASRLAYTGWTFVCTQPLDKFRAPVLSFFNLLLKLMVVVLVVAILLSFVISRKLASPIRQLLQRIHRTNISTLDASALSVIHTSINEMNELDDAYSQMSRQMKSSLDELLETREQEMKSRSMALQSQINPHFYYNTLSSIIILAENDRSDDVVSLCKNLSSVMHYVSDSSSATVHLREELDYVQKYLYCMKVRYQSSLDYTIDVPDELLDVAVPRLIIQPLVENGLKYGTNCEPPWRIDIRGQLTPDGWTVTVTDDGKGFSRDALETIARNIETADQTIGMPQTHISGLGLINVYSRWKLFSRSHFLFQYGNGEGGGSFVTIGWKAAESDGGN